MEMIEILHPRRKPSVQQRYKKKMENLQMELGRIQAISLNSPGEVCHLHHDHAHLLSQHNDVIAAVIPLGHLSIQLALLFLEAGHLFCDLRLLLLGQLGHDSLQEELWKMLRVSTRHIYMLSRSLRHRVLHHLTWFLWIQKHFSLLSRSE